MLLQPIYFAEPGDQVRNMIGFVVLMHVHCQQNWFRSVLLDSPELIPSTRPFVESEPAVSGLRMLGAPEDSQMLCVPCLARNI